MGNIWSAIGRYSPVDDQSGTGQDLNLNVLSDTIDVPKLVVAIDFGTYNSGYAFQYRSDYENERTTTIHVSEWQAPRMVTHKIPTCILLRPDESVDSFGYEAQMRFANLEQEKEDYIDWFFFSFFKMKLHQCQDLSEKTDLESAFGSTLPAIFVFSKAIEYMKKHFIDSLSTSGLSYPENETLWVLTVPAIWSDQAKQFMRKAAEKAGILSDKLVLALEPEAAAIFCSQISAQQMEIQGTDGKHRHVAVPGSTVMVVDLGGGTVDTITVEIGMDGTMKQVHEAIGDDSGGMKINEKFTLLMKEITSLSVWNEFASKYKQDELEFQMDFEYKKKVFGLKNGQERLIIKIPLTLKDVWEKQSGKLVEENIRRIEGCLQGKVKISSDKLSFDASLLIEFFQEPVSGILEKVRNIYQNALRSGRIDAVILVGGFAQSDLVTTNVRAGLANLQIPVVRPHSSELAVLKGAILFGHNPNIITSRVLRHTYGVGMNTDFVSGKHDENFKFRTPDGKFYAMNLFRKHAERGQEVKLNEWTKPVDYCVDERDQMSTDVCIYTSENKNPEYTNGCKYLGKLSVDFSQDGHPRPDTRRSKSIEVSLCFAGTELKVRAVDKNTRREYKACLQFF
ncbi:hypothetical protein ACJMK2_015411 [Sinanodonta woodiana]|uniref:Heat shock 70 kDa protein 12A n=1 Tax=Sinanodonta woodiana TaxID=1069815 RepID=A0ABD3UQ87_SINWO